MIQPDEKHLGSTLLPAASAIFLRMLIPSLWMHSLVRLAVNVTPDPAGDASTFLLWSSALVAYTMIPRIPEFFICPDYLQPVFEQIDQPKTVASRTADANLHSDNDSARQKPEKESAQLKAATRQAIEGT